MEIDLQEILCYPGVEGEGEILERPEALREAEEATRRLLSKMAT